MRRSPEQLYPDAELLRPERNAGFLRQCVDRFRRGRLRGPGDGPHLSLDRCRCSRLGRPRRAGTRHRRRLQRGAGFLAAAPAALDRCRTRGRPAPLPRRADRRRSARHARRVGTVLTEARCGNQAGVGQPPSGASARARPSPSLVHRGMLAGCPAIGDNAVIAVVIGIGHAPNRRAPAVLEALSHDGVRAIQPRGRDGLAGGALAITDDSRLLDRSLRTAPARTSCCRSRRSGSPTHCVDSRRSDSPDAM